MEFEGNIMHGREYWESSVRLSVGEDFGMFLEEGRKRKWEGKEEKEQRKVPPKKVMASLGEMAGSGSSSSSHMSPGWQVNDLDLDLPGELTMNEALLSLPSLAVFKQEAPSPTGAVLSPPRRAWPPRRQNERQITNLIVDNREPMDEGCEESPPHNNIMSQHSNSPESMQCQTMAPTMMDMSGYNSPNEHDNKNAGLLMCSPSSFDGFLQSPVRSETSYKDDSRFQYVLAAATSIATKQNEETLTYLNQGQPYEVKLKKLGDLSHSKGKILKSVIKICFHERRLQYMEREQIAQWHAQRPSERIIEVDVPLSYGVTRVEQPSALNSLHVYWDPTKDVGVYIKVNCISTEFTAKKHGGEKGVPFRIQVESYLASEESVRLHAAACQIKVFKLKGADRKHKQDREKVMRRPPSDIDKYQPGCEATVLTTLSNDALMPPLVVTTSPPYSPELCSPKVASPGPNKPVLSQPSIITTNQMKALYCQDAPEVKVATSCHSPGAILPDFPQPTDIDNDKNNGLSKEASSADTQAWLTRHRFAQHAATFSNFCGADLLRLSRDDIIQICGLADGIRLYNALHAKRIEPRLTVYVCASGSNIFSALYLDAYAASELLIKLKGLLHSAAAKECDTVLVSGPNGARVRLTDELVRHLPDSSTYKLEHVENSLLLSPTN
ncbi:transcription factor CP2 isoform X2 [Pieris rapae]|uniref:transcription factor CP2 isoform X2 n=1 Tax=Pieris rapae TaxID=64459 RepID=UPI000B926250|nr:transcription factor CP2 isoform X2 [Pieris rapae]